MKIKQLTMAVAAASVVVSGAATAAGHSEGVNSTVAIQVTGEAYGALRDRTNETVTPQDTSDWDLEDLRLGIIATVGENSRVIAEVGHDPGDTASTSSSSTVTRDLYYQHDFGNATVNAGRFKTISDRDAAVERSDAYFTDTFTPGGLDARIDGVEVMSTFEGGLHGSVSLFKGGVDVSGTSEADRQFGFAASGGWQGGNDDMSFGVTLYASQADGDDNGTTDTETSSFGINTFLASGPITATLSFEDSEDESTTAAVTTKDETDGFVLQAGLDLGGASRSFNEYGVLQGPGLSEGERGYEAVIAYISGENDDGTTKTDLDGWGIGLNMYCGQFVKWFVQYDALEADDGTAADIDGFSIGGRLNF